MEPINPMDVLLFNKNYLLFQDLIRDMRLRLKEILLEKSYRKGSFTLTSGKTSDFYIDTKQTSLDAEGGFLLGHIIFDMISMSLTEAVGGMTLGADPIVANVAMASFMRGVPIPAFIVRKEAKGHGTGNYIEGLRNMPIGCNTALIEDVVTTGGTLIKVIDRVKTQGYRVGDIITVVDRREGGKEELAKAGYTLRSIFTKEELLS